MEPRTSFLSLCARSFVWWLLTNMLVAALFYVRFQLFTVGHPEAPVANLLNLTLSLVASALALEILLLSFSVLPAILAFITLPIQLWALAAEQPQERRGRFLLAISAPFSLVTAAQILWWNYEQVDFTATYFVACLVAASLVYRRWLW